MTYLLSIPPIQTTYPNLVSKLPLHTSDQPPGVPAGRGLPVPAAHSARASPSQRQRKDRPTKPDKRGGRGEGGEEFLAESVCSVGCAV